MLKNMSKGKILIILLTILLLIFPFIVREMFFLSFMILCFTNIALASSWNIIGGIIGYPSFGHGVFFGLGAYVAALTIKYTGVSVLSIPFSIITTLAVSMALGYICLRLRGMFFSLATYNINYIFMLLFLLTPFTGGPEGVILKPIISTSPFVLETIFYYLYMIAVCVEIFIVYKLIKSKIGLGLFAIREDEDAARTCGVPVTRLKVLAYALSAAFQGVVGGLYAIYNCYIDPPTVFAFSISIYQIGSTYVGGAGTLPGPIIGAIITTLLSEYFRYTLGVMVEGLNIFIYAAIILCVLLFLPEGIYGRLVFLERMKGGKEYEKSAGSGWG